MAAYDFPDTAGKPTDGSFNYTAPDGTLYEWNGYAWEVPGGSGDSGGGGDFDIPTQALPPQVAEDGDLWWCTDDGRLYIYYEDVDTTQWVDASPDNGGAGSGDSSDSIWERSGSTINPVNSGDDVITGSPDSSSDADGATIQSNGVIRAQRAAVLADPGNALFSGLSGSTEVVKLSTDGGATFASTVSAPEVSAANVCTAWVNFAGTSLLIRNSFNINTITRSTTGKYKVYFADKMENPNYCVQVNSTGATAFIDEVTVDYVEVSAMNTSLDRADPTIVCVTIYGGNS